MFEIRTTLKFKKQRKKLNQDDKDLLDDIVFILANNQILFMILILKELQVFLKILGR